MQDTQKVNHEITDVDAELATIILDEAKGFFPALGTKFKLLIGGNLIECVLNRIACVAQRCPMAKERHDHIVLECPSLSSLIDVQRGNRLVFSKMGSLYIVEETTYFTRK
jgi:hypothetical protein